MTEKSQVRKRRTADEARAALLDVAARRLSERGLDGLNIVDVAKDAGMSHATLIHHFGNAAEMRRALAVRMTAELLTDVVTALRKQVPETELLISLFDTLNAKGHAKLLAWLSVADTQQQRPTAETFALFRDLVAACADRMPDHDLEDAQRMIMLVAALAIGVGVVGPVLPELLGMDENDCREFPRWVSDRILDGPT